MRIISNSSPWTFPARCALVCWITLGCAANGTVGQESVAAADTSAFSVVLRAMLADSARMAGLQVDPRPIKVGSVMVLEETRAPATPAELQARTATLRRLGLTEGDATFPPNCGGVMVPPVPGSRAHIGCPSTGRQVAVMSAADRFVDTAAVRPVVPRDLWAARVILVAMGKAGISAESRDYVLSRRDGRWRFEKMILRGWYE